MDELVLSGKRYISSRRAGKEHGYHTDYIGQLIRSGKVRGQKVGRAWYVEEESLRSYLGSESQESKVETIPNTEPVPETVKELEEVPEAIVSETTSEVAPESDLEVLTEVPQEEAVELAVEEAVETPVDIKIEIPKLEPVREIPLQIFAANVDSKPKLVYLEEEAEPVSEIEIEEYEEKAPAIPEHRPTKVRRAGVAFALCIVAVCAFGVAAGVARLVEGVVTVGDGMTASATYSIDW